MISSKRSKALPALAPSPAGISVNLLSFLRQNREFTLDLGLRGLLVVAGIVFLQLPMVIAGVLILIPMYIKFRKVAKFFMAGEAHAAKIICLEPQMIAIYGDLAKATLEPQPVIVVSKVNLPLSGQAEKGDRIGVVAIPVGGDTKRFDRLDFKLASMVIEGPEVLDLLLNSIAVWQWEELDEALFEIPRPYMEGVYAAGLVGTLN